MYTDITIGVTLICTGWLWSSTYDIQILMDGITWLFLVIVLRNIAEYQTAFGTVQPLVVFNVTYKHKYIFIIN